MKYLLFFLLVAGSFAVFAAEDGAAEKVAEHMAMYKKGFVEEAVAGLKSEKAAHPEAVEPAFNLGYIYGRLQMNREAAAEFEYCLQINPDLPDVHFNLGTVLNADGDYENAALHFEEALLLDPTYTDAMYNCGIAYFNLGRYVDAIRMYKDAEKLDPESLDIKFNIALTYEELDPQMALRLWEKFLDDSKDNPNGDYYAAASKRIEVLRGKVAR